MIGLGFTLNPTHSCEAPSYRDNPINPSNSNNTAGEPTRLLDEQAKGSRL